MASKINSVDLGPIWLQSGDGVPNHLGVKGTIFIDLANAGQYINSNGLSNWDKFLTSSSGSGGTDSYTTSAILSGNVIHYANNLYGPNFYSVDLTSIISDKELIANKQNSMIYDGTGIKYPTVDTVNHQSNNLLIPTANTGFIDRLDPFTMVLTNPSTITITGSNPGALIRTRLFAPPFVPLDAIRNISGRTFSSSSITLPSDGRFYRYLGYDYSTDSIVNSTASYVTSDNIVALGFVEMFKSGSTQIFSSFQMQVDISTVTLFDTVMVSSTSTANVFPNTGLTVNNNFGGLLKANAINWGQLNPHVRNIPAINPIGFIRINPSYLTTLTGFTTGTSVDTTTYWNGSALVSTGNNNSASIQRWLMCLDGRIFLQAAEQTFTKYSDAVAAVNTVQFTEIIPTELVIELCRMVSLKITTNLADIAQTQFFYGTGAGSTGGGTASFGTIGGSPYDNLLLGAELNSKFNVTGGTISGNTNILGGLTANTISATTYQNLPLDIRVTGGTYTNGTATFRNNSGGTFNVTGFKTSDLVVTGGTYNGVTDIITFRNSTGGTFNVTGITDTFVSGMTFNTGNYNLSVQRNDGVTFTQSLGILASDMNVTGGTYDINTGVVTFTNNSGGTFQVTGFTSGMTDSYTTGAILSGNSITFNNNIQGPNYYNVSLNPLLSGKTDNTTFSSYTASTNAILNTKANTATTLNINGVVQNLSTNRTWVTAQADTGVLSFGGLSSASTTTINVGAIKGYIIDNETNPLVPTYTYIDYSGQTGVSVTTRLTGQESFVFINSASTITFQNTFPTSTDRKNKIWLGKISHPVNLVTLVIDEPDYITSPMGLTRDFYQKISYINEGVYPYANGANLNINITGGKIGGNGINFVNDKTNPNDLSMGPSITQTFTYRTQTGGTSTGVTVIDPTRYDLTGTATLIGGGPNASTIQYIFAVPGKGYVIQYGQNVYNTLTEAIGAIGRETFTPYPNLIKNTILIGVLALKKSATALNDLTQAQFFRADLFGGIIGSTAGVAVSTLQTAYNNSLVPQIVVSDALGALTIQNGRASNLSNIIVGQNIGGVNTFSVNGDGNITGTTFVKSGGTSSQFLMADGSTSVAGGSGTIAGSGTTNFVSKWTGATGQGNSIIYDNGIGVGIGTTTPIGKLNIVTGLSGNTFNFPSQELGSISFSNSSTLTQPTISSKSDTSTGLLLIAGANENNLFADMRFSVRENDGTDFTGFTSSAFRFDRVSTTLVDILRNGNVGIGTSTPNHKLEVNGFIASNGFFKSGSTATDILLGNGSSVSTNTFHQLRGSYGAGGENIDTLTTSGNWLLSTLSTGTKPSFTIRNFVVIKSQEPSSFITQVAYADATGRHAVRSSTDIGVTWSPWVETFYGSGTTNTVSKWTGQFSQGNSNIVDNGSNVAINSYAYTPLNFGIGGTHSTSMKLNLSGVISGGTTAYGIFNQPNILSSVTTAAYYNRTLAQTEAAPFTLGAIYHNFASQGVFGSGSSVNQQIGFYVASSLVDATTNIGFRSQIPSNTGNTNWNNYHDGTAPNYFGGSVNVGTTLPMGGAVMTLRSDDVLLALKNITNGTNAVPKSRRLSWFTSASNECGSIDVPDSLTNTNATQMVFTTKDTLASNSEKMRIAVGGNVGIGTSTPMGKFNVVTGLSGGTFGLTSQELGSIAFSNNSTTLCSPTISSKSDTAIGLTLIAGTLDASASPDMRFNVRELDNTDFTGLTSTAFRFDRFSTALVDILRNGNMGIGYTTPNAKLQVVDTQVGLPSDTLILGNGSGTSGSTSGVLFAPSASQDGLRGARISALQKGSNNIDLLFSTGSGIPPIERMRLTAIGNLGIGNATPNGKLDVLTANIANSLTFGSTSSVIIGSTIRELAINAGDIGGTFSMSMQARTNANTSSPLLLQPLGGEVGIGTTTPVGKLDIFTGISGITSNAGNTNIPFGSISIGNGSSTAASPLIVGRSNDSIGLSFQAGSNETNLNPDMNFNVRRNTNADFTGLTSTAYRFGRFNTSLVDILRNGYMGLGYTDPQERLEVAGNISFTNGSGLKVRGVTYTNILTTGYNGANDFTSLYTGGNVLGNSTPKITMLDNGSVGVGITAPIGRLDINTATGNTFNAITQTTGSISIGNLSSSGAQIPAIIGKSFSGNTGIVLMGVTSEVNVNPDMRFEIRENDNSDFSDRTTSGFEFTRFGTTLVNILRNGSVGIGTSTPTLGKLQVFGVQNSRMIHGESNLTPTSGVTMAQGISMAQLNIEGIVNAGYAIVGNNVNPTSSLGVISQTAQSSDTGTVPLNLIQGNRLTDAGAVGNFVVNRPILGVSNFSTRLMTILANGNTGIGTSTPSSKFHVNVSDNTPYSSTGLTTNQISVNNIHNSGGTGTQSFLSLGSSANNSSNNSIGIIAVIQPTASSHETDMAFKVRTNSGTMLEAIKIKSSGNVGIGTTSNPTEKLEVNGIVKATSFSISALNTAPASSGATGTIGEIRYDANFMYLCTATNTWKRSPLSSW